ncbi:hypothetical protein P879_09818 [Paragonimus westermani]|uniref:Uncharacterized protein n=1 Tax=Paragonimus westermani TaxID=34504 RepID=A0A8T0DK82_9TREM|nr:hypothetical protein P879_09818 [Paragonimus westermani]
MKLQLMQLFWLLPAITQSTVVYTADQRAHKGHTDKLPEMKQEVIDFVCKIRSSKRLLLTNTVV